MILQYSGKSILNPCYLSLKIRQLNVDEPYFRSIKNKDDIIMYIVDHQWWLIDNGCGGERSDRFVFSAIIIY